MLYFDKKNIQTLGIALLSFLTLLLLVFYPQHSFQAALRGLDLWLRVVFPALLPFFIGTEIMVGVGMVDFISMLLGPLMMPIFGCSGYGSFIWAMSMVSGYPMGAKLTASFRKQNKITKIEGQKILAFASISGPLFMVGAVGIGMFSSAKAGNIILISHYSAAIIIGIFFRRYRDSSIPDLGNQNGNILNKLNKAFETLYDARKKDGRTFGELLGDAVKNSVNSILLIGGFIVLFSVIIDLLMMIGVISTLSRILEYLTAFSKYPSELLKGLSAGIFEVTMGCKILGGVNAPLIHKIPIATFLIGWSGFSIHGQAISFLSKTDISISRYLLTKLTHGILSGFVSWIIIKFFYHGEIQVFNLDDMTFEGTWRYWFLSSAKLLGIAVLMLLCIIITYRLVIILYNHIKNNKPAKYNRL